MNLPVADLENLFEIFSSDDEYGYDFFIVIITRMLGPRIGYAAQIFEKKGINCRSEWEKRSKDGQPNEVEENPKDPSRLHETDERV
jgi:hypothetical protein